MAASWTGTAGHTLTWALKNAAGTTLKAGSSTEASGSWHVRWVLSGTLTEPPYVSVCDGTNCVTCNSGEVKMSATMETGDLTQWTGAAADSGACETHAASTDFAHTGTYSMKLVITAPNPNGGGSSGCRQHDSWSKDGNPYYYSAWYYIPTYTEPQAWSSPSGWWNIFQMKSKDYNDTVYGQANDPIYTLNPMPNVADGPLYLRLCWWPDAGYAASHGHAQYPVNGPYASDDESKKFYTQNIAPVPVGQWFHIEMYVKQSNQFDGVVKIWQDGVLLWDLQNVRTNFPNVGAPAGFPHQWWAVNNYSNNIMCGSGHDTHTCPLYIDDAKVATYRVGP